MVNDDVSKSSMYNTVYYYFYEKEKDYRHRIIEIEHPDLDNLIERAKR